MIRNYNIIRSILTEPWLISEEEAGKLGYLLAGVFSPGMAFDPVGREEAASVTFVAHITGEPSGRIRNVGVVRMTGTLSKYDPECAYGMESYGHMLRAFADDDSIDAIVISGDSPGGMVQGTEELGHLIRSIGKPVVGFVSDIACSGMYWILSCCREIIANNSTACVGSIGVLSTIWDVSDFYERQGIKIHEILAPQSKDKREETAQVKAGNYDLTRARLRVIADKFQSVVKTNRPSVEDSQMTGKVYFAGDVIGTLVDGIGTFESALERAAALATTNQNNDNMTKNQFPALAQAAGVEAFESVDGSITLTAEMAAAIDSALSNGSIGSEKEASKTAGDMADANRRIGTLEAEAKAKDERIAELEKLPGDAGAVVSPATDGTAAGNEPAADMATAFASAREFLSTLKN